MQRKTPTGEHADVAERFAFLLDALELDRDGFAAAVDHAVTARSLFAVLSGDRRPSRALAVLIERTFGFRADHLLHGTGPMWRRDPLDASAPPTTDTEERLLAFARRSVDNAQVLEAEVVRAETWETLWARALRLLGRLDVLAAGDDPHAYPEAATATLEACWRMSEAFTAWVRIAEDRRVLRLTQQYVRRYLMQVPAQLVERGAMTADELAALRDRAERVLDALDQQTSALADEADRRLQVLDRLRGAGDVGMPTHSVADDLDRLLSRVETRVLDAV